jgi:hypothetical protein
MITFPFGAAFYQGAISAGRSMANNIRCKERHQGNGETQCKMAPCGKKEMPSMGCPTVPYTAP